MPSHNLELIRGMRRKKQIPEVKWGVLDRSLNLAVPVLRSQAME